MSIGQLKVIHRRPGSRRSRRWKVVVVSSLLIGSSLIAPFVDTPSAFAVPSCPGSFQYDYVANDWTPSSNPQGIRSPIVLVTDTTPCNSGSIVTTGIAAGYIAIDNDAGTKISQIGFYSYWDPSLSTTTYCKFWAIDGGSPNFYGPCSLDNNHQTFFKIHTYTSGGSTVYRLDDCSSDSTYGTCTVENADEAEYSNSYAFTAEETDYGGSSCTVKIMGSSSNHFNIGTSTDGVQGQTTEGGGWSTQNFIYIPPNCSHYQANAGNTKMGVWDDRN
ncbi:MAG TPA: hypothetical protein VG708_05105 [Mycobacteriales bacterium]|jgi:hypothetical protein|nr:hypothetical protein [Mycobacteriales bacterium]